MSQLVLISNTGSARDALVDALKVNGVHCLCAPKDQALQMACSTQTTCVVLLDDASSFAAELLQHIRATQVLAHTLVVVIAAKLLASSNNTTHVVCVEHTNCIACSCKAHKQCTPLILSASTSASRAEPVFEINTSCDMVRWRV